MAKGKKTGGRDWKPGESGNPSGRPPLPEHLKGVKKMNKHQFESILNKYIHLSLNELIELLKGGDLPAIEAMVVKVLTEAVRKGDEKRLNFVLDRLIGKVQENFKVEGDPYANLMKIISDRKETND